MDHVIKVHIYKVYIFPYMFPALKQNLRDQRFKDDFEVVTIATVATRWLVKHDTDSSQNGVENLYSI
jgi:hypothetical protein